MIFNVDNCGRGFFAVTHKKKAGASAAVRRGIPGEGGRTSESDWAAWALRTQNDERCPGLFVQNLALSNLFPEI